MREDPGRHHPHVLEPEGAAERLAALVEQALPIFEAARDDLALYTAYHALAQVEFEHAQADAALEAFERAAAHARRAGLPQEFLDWRAACRFYGTTPVSECWRGSTSTSHEPGGTTGSACPGPMALAMLGRFDEARAILAEARAELAERGGGIRLAVTTGIESVDVELLAGDPAAAAELGAEGCRMFEELGDMASCPPRPASLAQALYALDRLEEADAWAGRAAELGASDDAFTSCSGGR